MDQVFEFHLFCTVPVKPIITRAAVNTLELEQLIEEFSLFKSNTASELMRRNYVRRQHEQKRKMLAKLEDNNLHTESQVRCCKKGKERNFSVSSRATAGALIGDTVNGN